MNRSRNWFLHHREEPAAAAPAVPSFRTGAPRTRAKARTAALALLLLGLAMTPLRSSPAPRPQDVWQEWVRFYSRLNLILASVADPPSMRQAVASLQQLHGEIRAIQERELRVDFSGASEHAGEVFVALLNIQKNFDGNLRRIAQHPELEAPIRAALDELFLCLRTPLRNAG